MNFLSCVCVIVYLGIVAGVPQECSQGCDQNKCSADGRCVQGCYSGYSGEKCDICTSSYFWNEQYHQCHVCPTLCHTCVTLTNCTECVSESSYGDTCELTCSHGCVNRTCDRNTGHCTCEYGFAGDSCDTCSEGFYQNLYNCIACPNECNTCRYQSLSEQVVCQTCIDGFYGETCQLACPEGCSTNVCGANGTCETGCKVGFEGAICDKCVAGKWGADCDTDCPESCVRCNSDVACSSCKTGYFGDGCQMACPGGCNGSCDKTSSACSPCKEGYSGDMCCVQNNNCATCSSGTECLECLAGFHGTSCDKTCPPNCRNCSNMDECGSCKDGFVGNDCSSTCPENCVSCESPTTCHKCDVGYFGIACNSECGENCLNLACGKVSGSCDHGCKEGFEGTNCSEVSSGARPTMFVGVSLLSVIFRVLA